MKVLKIISIATGKVSTHYTEDGIRPLCNLGTGVKRIVKKNTPVSCGQCRKNIVATGAKKIRNESFLTSNRQTKARRQDI